MNGKIIWIKRKLDENEEEEKSRKDNVRKMLKRNNITSNLSENK